MAKKRTPGPKLGEGSVTRDRFLRLHRLLGLLAEGTHTRAVLLRRLRQDVRGFYRDLETLRKIDVRVTVHLGRYGLADALDEARSRLTIPDPHLTLCEAGLLAKGRSAVHRKLKGVVDKLTGS